MKKNPNQKILSGQRPNTGLGMAYQKRLDALIDAMQKSLVYWIRAAYNAKPPINMAQDADYRGSPAMVLRRTMKRLAAQWQDNFNTAAPAMAEHFSKAFAQRSDQQLASALRKAGVSVKFQQTAGMNDALQAAIGENVALIKSIAQQHLSDVEGLVLRSVAAGRDIGALGQELEQRYDITKRRARLIAHHQNNLATATMQRVRYKELGITEAIWCHSHAGAKPRPSHVKAGAEKLRFDPDKGAFIDNEWILPGQLINCRCFSKPVLAGM